MEWNTKKREREIKLLPRLDFFGYSRKCHHYFKSPWYKYSERYSLIKKYKLIIWTIISYLGLILNKKNWKNI